MLSRANNLPIPLVRNDSLDSCQLLPGMNDGRSNHDFGAHGGGVDVSHVEIPGQSAEFLLATQFARTRKKKTFNAHKCCQKFGDVANAIDVQISRISAAAPT